MTENQEQPNLEQLVAAAKAAEGAAFAYKPINKDGAYTRESFVASKEDLNDIGEYGERVLKDPFDLGAREDLFGLLYGDPNFHRGFSPEDIKKTASAAIKDGVESMGRYVEKNRNKFLDLLDNKSMYNLMFSVPLYKTGNEEHDTLVGMVNDAKSMASMTQSEEPLEKMREFVLKRTKSDKVPDWAKSLIVYFSGDPKFVQRVFGAEFNVKQKVLAAAFADGKENDGARARKVLETSLDKAHDELENEDNSKKERKDIWEKAIRPYYLAISDAAYEVEEKAFKKEIEAEVEKKERKTERKKLGMAA